MGKKAVRHGSVGKNDFLSSNLTLSVIYCPSGLLGEAVA
jgi:hypothetical protein